MTAVVVEEDVWFDGAFSISLADVWWFQSSKRDGVAALTGSGSGFLLRRGGRTSFRAPTTQLARGKSEGSSPTRIPWQS